MGTLKLLRIIIQTLFVVGILYLALFLEIRIMPGISSLPGVIFLGISSVLEYRNNYGWHSVFIGLGIALCFSWLFYLTFAILRVHHEDDNSVSIVQPLYPWIGEKLAEGESVDTLVLTSGYITNYGRYKINENVYFLLRKEDDQFVFFGLYGKIFEGKSLKIEKREYEHGPIDVCDFVGIDGKRHTFDLYGQNVDGIGYSPKTIDFSGINAPTM